MHKNFNDFLHDWPRPYLFGIDISYFFESTPNSHYSRVKRAFKQGKLLPIKIDLYVITTKLLVDTYELAGIIHGPSYISFESSLEILWTHT